MKRPNPRVNKSLSHDAKMNGKSNTPTLLPPSRSLYEAVRTHLSALQSAPGLLAAVGGALRAVEAVHPQAYTEATTRLAQAQDDPGLGREYRKVSRAAAWQSWAGCEYIVFQMRYIMLLEEYDENKGVHSFFTL